MDNKVISKKSFSLFITIILVMIFAALSISIVETKVTSSNIDKLKYLNLQANIHLEYVKEYISTHTTDEVLSLNLDDSRFDLSISSFEENNISKYHIYIKTIDETPISIYLIL